MSTSNNEQPILKKLKPNEEKAIETSSSGEKTIKMENIKQKQLTIITISSFLNNNISTSNKKRKHDEIEGNEPENETTEIPESGEFEKSKSSTLDEPSQVGSDPEFL